jgi:hypothetical protein
MARIRQICPFPRYYCPLLYTVHWSGEKFVGHFDSIYRKNGSFYPFLSSSIASGLETFGLVTKIGRLKICAAKKIGG